MLLYSVEYRYLIANLPTGYQYLPILAAFIITPEIVAVVLSLWPPDSLLSSVHFTTVAESAGSRFFWSEPALILGSGLASGHELENGRGIFFL